MLLFLSACAHVEKGAPELLDPLEMAPFQDDMDVESLRAAIEQSLDYYNRVPADRTFALGTRQVTAAELKETLTEFIALLDGGRMPTAAVLAQHFDVYRVPSDRKDGHALVTGYFLPELEGSLTRDEEYNCPLHGIPPDLLKIDLSDFNVKNLPDKTLVGRVEKGRVVPYFTRAEILGQDRLEDCGCVLVWVKDPIGAFFLHVQGSGIIDFPDGSRRVIGYAGVNGRTYNSIGGLLIRSGEIPKEDMSMQAITAYLTEHPERRDEVFDYNESYVFFHWVDNGPLGSLGRKITAGRSVALDHGVYPKGALAFLSTELPILDGEHRVVGWRPSSRWVLSQDTGGAIRGSGRIDLFCGGGPEAEAIAGHMKQTGEILFLLKKSAKVDK